MPGRFEEDVVISQIACGLRYVNPDGCAAGLPLHHVKMILQKGSGGRSLVEQSDPRAARIENLRADVITVCGEPKEIPIPGRKSAPFCMVSVMVRVMGLAAISRSTVLPTPNVLTDILRELGRGRMSTRVSLFQ